ncbi:uncharacterized protein [Solanum lycopersicum]|uniref:uncharacterized protein n=1 Tax=Solanum lycopersicum TaxID=4081 RepID=UPI00374805DB
MRSKDTEKAELASYQLKDVAQTWCTVLPDSQFLEEFREIREAKIEEFINLKQEYMIVKEYSPKYATFLVSNSRDDMSRFLTGINRDLENECPPAILHDKMDLSRLMEHVKFKKGQQSSRNSNSQRSKTPRGGRPEPKNGNGVESSDRALMPASVPVRVGVWLEFAHRIEVRLEGGVGEIFICGHWYAASILNFYYALLDPGSTLSFVTPLLSLTFEILPDVLHDPIVVSTPLGENVIVDRVYKDCLIVVCVTFLGHVVSDQGVKVDPRKTEVVKNCTKPFTLTNIRSFLGLPVYYRSFLEAFSCIAASQTALTKKKDKFEWTEICERSFQKLKYRLS